MAVIVLAWCLQRTQWQLLAYRAHEVNKFVSQRDIESVRIDGAVLVVVVRHIRGCDVMLTTADAGKLFA